MATNDNKAGILPLGGGASDKWPKHLAIPLLGREQVADHERLKQKLKLEQQARDDGAHGLPHKDDHDLNAMQRRICEEIFRGIASVHRFLAEQLARAAQLLAGLRPLGIDEELMAQAAAIRDATNPDETLFVLDAMIGQDAVATAEAFGSGVGFAFSPFTTTQQTSSDVNRTLGVLIGPAPSSGRRRSARSRRSPR